MILKKLKDISYILFLLPLFFISENITAQCDVFIEPGSVQVTETSDAVMFTFDVINNSTSEWTGDEVLMYWSLNSSVNIMNIQYGDGSDAGHPAPLLPGESATFYTPWMAIPNLPEWFPEDPGPGGDLDDYWVDALDWAFWSANPNGFDGTWSQINLRLGSCGLGDGAWVYDDNGDPYYGPFNESVCQDNNDDGFCDCDINVTGYDQDTHMVSIEVNSSYNCGCNYLTDNNYMDCYNSTSGQNNTSIKHLVFGLNVQTLDEDWLGCLDNSFHEGWVFGYLNFTFNPLESGDMVSEEINIFNDCWDTMQDLAPNSLCLQMVVWQINFSQTAYVFDTYGGLPGWAATCGNCNYDTQEYPDVDIDNNLVVWCFNDNPPEPDIPGCTDPEANNYNPEANIDDESCEYDVLGCTDPVACNYDSSANINDGTCIYCGPDCIWENPNICEGCTDINATNYSETAIYDDGSCEYPSPDAVPSFNFIGYECIDGVPYNMAKITVVNSYFQGNTADDTLFVYCVEIPELGLDTCLNGYTSASSWIEPGGGQLIWNNIIIPNDVIEITVNVYNTEGETDEELLNNTITVLNIMQGNEVCEVLGCTDPEAVNYNPEATDDDGSCQYPIVTDLSFDTLLYDTGCDEFGPYWSAQLYLTNQGTTPITEWCIQADILSTPEIDTICFNFTTIMPGETYIQQWPNVYDWGVLSLHVLHINGNSGVFWNQFGDDTDVADNMYVQIISDEPNCDILGCTDPDADNYNETATVDDGSCEIGGCTIVEACNYDPNATYNDDTCDFETCVGCTDPEALNYSPTATEDDGSCIYPVPGCTDENAINYNPFANVDDGSCIDPIVGCMIPEALNYNPLANITCVPIDECCEFPVPGCTDETANNYNSEANVDDGSCEYDITELTYVGAECSVDCDLSGPFYYVITTWTNTGNVEITNFCVEWDIVGGEFDDQECWSGSLLPGDTTQLQFGPYNTNATPIAWAYLQVINGVTLDPQINNYETIYCYGEAESSCVYGCTDPEANNYNEEADINDESCEYDVFGCTDSTALNYNPFANIDDGSCEYEVYGCTDPEALNFNPLATVDNGTCVYQEPCDSFTGSVYISNSFTPDNDGTNDLWKAFTVQDCWDKWELTILNRWGGVIWYSTDPSDEWDGTFKDNGEYVQNGMYVYKLKAVTTNLNYVDKNGYIMVIR